MMGNEALINGKWLKVGDRVSGKEVLSVNVGGVVLLENGVELTLPMNGFQLGASLKKAVPKMPIPSGVPEVKITPIHNRSKTLNKR